MIGLPALSACLGTLALVFVATTAQDNPKKDPTKDQGEKKDAVVVMSADEAKYKEVAPGASMAVIWGDPDKGAYRGFTKFAPGATFALHTHTSETRIVVIKGAYMYRPEKGDEKRVGPGAYIDIPAGERHSSGGDAKDGALFYQESAGKFDLNFIEPKK